MRKGANGAGILSGERFKITVKAANTEVIAIVLVSIYEFTLEAAIPNGKSIFII